MNTSLRHVLIDGYHLRTWDTGRLDDRGQLFTRYELTAPDGEVIFSGADFSCSPMHAIDSDDALRGLLDFLTLKPGDTDPDYFASYTERQHAFAANEAEALSIWAMEDDDAPAFVDVED